jgi:hypothetical protein
MDLMPEVLGWPDDGRMEYKGARYKIKNSTADPYPFVVRHQPWLSKTALLLQLDLLLLLDKAEAQSVPGRMAPKQYVPCDSTVN